MRTTALLPSAARLAATVLLLTSAGQAQQTFTNTGYTTYGPWWAEGSASPAEWKPGERVRVRAKLTLGEQHLRSLAEDKIVVDGFALLVTAERTFDSTGWLRFGADDRMSTLLTPAGLPIEGGTRGAISKRFGGPFQTPLDVLVKAPLTAAERIDGRVETTFNAEGALAADLPPGIYRLRLDYGVTVGSRYYSLQARTFAAYGFSIGGKEVQSHQYSPLFRASGPDADGKFIDASTLTPRIPFALLHAYNSNGYRGVVAEEDAHRFNIASRNLIQDDVILPRFDTAGKAITYSLAGC